MKATSTTKKMVKKILAHYQVLGTRAVCVLFLW